MILRKRLDDYFTLADLAKNLPGRPHVATCRRWSSRGISGIRLNTFMIGGKRCTNWQLFHEFVAAVSAKKSNCPTSHQKTEDQIRPFERSASSKIGFEQASRELDRRGI